MNAQEARQMAQNTTDVKASTQLSEILNQIKQQAGLGRFELWYYKRLESAVKSKLQELGYNIGPEQVDLNEILINISW